MKLSALANARWAMWGMVTAFLLFIAWASVARIDQVTRATAQVVVASRIQLIQSTDGGTITQLHVREGDAVQVGQLLVTLEKARAEAAAADSQQRVAALQTTLARLNAEVYGTPLAFDPELQRFPDFVRNQTELYQKRRTALNDDINALQGILKLAQEELEIFQLLETTGDVSRSEVLRLQRTVADITAQIVNKRNAFFQEAQADMTRAQEELATQIEQLRDRMQVLEQTELRALVDGVVNHIRVSTLGGVIRPGETVMEIVPNNEVLLVEAKVAPGDIAFVSVGQEASIKLDAFDPTIFGGLTGVVHHISPDVVKEDTPQGPQSYFIVHIMATDTEFVGRRAEQIQLRPGLTGSVDIKSNDRTVLSYLTKPIIKTIDLGLGER